MFGSGRFPETYFPSYFPLSSSSSPSPFLPFTPFLPLLPSLHFSPSLPFPPFLFSSLPSPSLPLTFSSPLLLLSPTRGEPPTTPNCPPGVEPNVVTDLSPGDESMTEGRLP